MRMGTGRCLAWLVCLAIVVLSWLLCLVMLLVSSVSGDILPRPPGEGSSGQERGEGPGLKKPPSRGGALATATGTTSFPGRVAACGTADGRAEQPTRVGARGGTWRVSHQAGQRHQRARA